MKFSTPFFFLASLALGFSVSAQEVADPVEIAFSFDQGTLTNGERTSTFKQIWTSTATNPGLVIDCGANNIATAECSGNFRNNSNDPVIFGGSSSTCTLTLTPSEGWRVSAYSFEAKQFAQLPVAMTVNANGQTITTTAAAQSVNVSLSKSTAPSIVISGGNNGVHFSNFVFTLSPIVEGDEPALSVDPMPEADANCAFTVTNLVDGDYNDFTAWYHIQDNKNFLTGKSLTNMGRQGDFSDAYLFCFIKEADGSYAIYNKAEGKTALTYADGKVLNGTEEVDVTLARQFLPVSLDYGKVYRNSTNNMNAGAWGDTWRSFYSPEVTLKGAKNNMTFYNATADTPARIVLESGSNNQAGNFTWAFGAGSNMYVSAYSFLAKKEGVFTDECSITANGTTTALNNYYQRIEATNSEDLSATAFVQRSVNTKGIEIADGYVTVSRILTHHNTRTAFPVFVRNAYNNQRRIPAITTVEAGDRAGRLIAVYDNRPCNQDIGAGNIGLEIAVSDDNGLTWSTPDYGRNANGIATTGWNPDFTVSSSLTMAMMQADANTYWNCAVGDAAIVSDRETGRVLMMAAAGPMNFFSGRRHNNPNQCVRWYSEDGGETWSEPTRMTDHILELFDGEPAFGYIDSQFIGSGRIMQSHQVKVGEYYRLYAVLSSQNGGGNTRNWVLYSDDFGGNWHVLGGLDRAAVPSGADEPKAEELPDGSVLLAARGNGGAGSNRNFNIFRYTDVENGLGRWDNHVNTDMGFGTINACDGEIMIIPAVDNETAQPCYLALQSFTNSVNREFVSIAYKPLNEAADIATPSAFTSWEARYRVSSGSSAYSTMCWQKDNTLGFFYEEEQTGVYDGVYINLTIEEITDGRYSYQPDANGAKAAELRDALVDLRAESYSPVRNGYVGEIVDPEAFANAVADFKANPSDAAYIEINKAEYAPAVEEIQTGGVYRFISAHNGTYSGVRGPVNTDRDVFLATDGTNMVATNDASGNSHLFTVNRTESGNWSLLNKEHNLYPANSPAASNQFAVSAEPTEYVITSALDGRSSLASANPTNATHRGLHLDGQGKIVAWNPNAGASQWYMELVEAPAASEIKSIEAAEGATIYFDLSGRRVANPTNGIFITNHGKKVLF